MTEGPTFSDAELSRLRLEGLEHLVRLQSGSATHSDAAAFLAWRGQGRAHEEALRSALELKGLVRRVYSEELRAAEHVSPEVPPAELDNVVFLERAQNRRVTRRGILTGALAASAAGILLTTGRTLDLIPDPVRLRADVSTGAGERRQLQLAGGATALLNTRTSIVYRNDLDVPAIELLAGEAILTSPQEGRAALVAGKGTSMGEGARWTARRDGDRVCVTCLDGEVEVAWATSKRNLKPGQEVVYDDGALGVIKQGADAQVLTAWQSGTLIFQDMPVRDVVAEINRYRAGKVYVANETLAHRQLSGTYYINRIDDFFLQAETGLGITVRKLPGDVVILS